MFLLTAGVLIVAGGLDVVCFFADLTVVAVFALAFFSMFRSARSGISAFSSSSMATIGAGKGRLDSTPSCTIGVSVDTRTDATMGRSGALSGFGRRTTVVFTGLVGQMLWRVAITPLIFSGRGTSSAGNSLTIGSSLWLCTLTLTFLSARSEYTTVIVHLS